MSLERQCQAVVTTLYVAFMNISSLCGICGISALVLWQQLYFFFHSGTAVQKTCAMRWDLIIIFFLALEKGIMFFRRI